MAELLELIQCFSEQYSLTLEQKDEGTYLLRHKYKYLYLAFGDTHNFYYKIENEEVAYGHFIDSESLIKILTWIL